MKSATALAKELLDGDPGGLEELRVHEFTGDESAHDDELTERLHADFSAEFEGVEKDLTKLYGPPSRTGETDDEDLQIIVACQAQSPGCA